MELITVLAAILAVAVIFFASIKSLLWLAETVWDNAFLMLSLIILFIIFGL
jgi:hypothetical protein